MSQLISAVRVSEGYHIEIDFKISQRQLGLEQEYETVLASTHKKHRDDMTI